MAWETGTTNGYRDLLEKLRVFASTNGWKVERWVNDPDKKADDELILSTKGKSSKEYYIVGFKLSFDIAADRYNWKLIAGPQYSAGSGFENMGGSTAIQYIYLWRNAIDYYFILDADHIKIIAQISGTTHCAYLGKLQMYCSLGHWPRQVGCYGEGVDPNGSWSSQGNDYSTFQWFRNDARSVLWTDGNYISPSKIQPQMYSHSSLLYKGGQNSEQHWMMPMIVTHSSKGALGEFIGCYYTDGHDTSSMSILKSPAAVREFLVVQNIYRTGNRDFMAMELK